MSTTYVNTIDAKEEFSELINRVSHHKERVILTRRGKEIAAIVPLEDFLEIEQKQNKNDLEAALEALQEARTRGTITLEDFKSEVGLPVTNTPYHVKIAPAAQRQLRGLQNKNQNNIIKLIETLAINPRPPGVSKIEGMTGLYCENVNHHRLIYKVEEQEILLLLVL